MKPQSPQPAPRETKPAKATPRARWQPRFGLGAMLLVMLVCGVMSSAGYYLVRGNIARPGPEGGANRLQLVFLLITLASPLLLAAAISIALQLSRLFNRRR